MLKKQIQTAMGSMRLPVFASSAFLCVMLLSGCSKAPIVERGGGVVIIGGSGGSGSGTSALNNGSFRATVQEHDAQKCGQGQDWKTH